MCKTECKNCGFPEDIGCVPLSELAKSSAQDKVEKRKAAISALQSCPYASTLAAEIAISYGHEVTYQEETAAYRAQYGDDESYVEWS